MTERMYDLDTLDQLGVTIDREGPAVFHVQIDGSDLIAVRLLPDGTAEVLIHADTAPDADPAGTVRVRWDGVLVHEERRLRGECAECAALPGPDDEEEGVTGP